MAKIKRLVLDVVKPQEPSLVEFAGKLGGTKGVEGVNVSLLEVDRKVENVRITFEGGDVPANALMDAIEQMGGAIHSVDEVATGARLVAQAKTTGEG
jgi:hypothetical protein